MSSGSKAQKIERILKRDAPRPETPPQPPAESFFDRLRERLKGSGAFYTLLVRLFSPVLPARAFRQCIERTLGRHGRQEVILNLGSGPGALPERDDIIHVDLFDHPGVDLVADIAALPLEDATVDLALNIAVLEHVPNPGKVVAEMLRVLRPGGEALVFMPFLQPFHAAPDDYCRLTRPGLKNWFSQWDVLETGIGSGPTSALLWTAQHWLAMILSLGSARTYGLLLTLVMACTWPVKHLDRLLDHHPRAEDAAGGFYVLARKKR